MTSKVIEGVVVRAHEKQINTKNGQKAVFSLLINTGNKEEWFSFSFDKPAASENQQVKFVVTQNGQYWNADAKTVEVIKTVEASAPAVMAKAVRSVDNTQRSIVFQSAYERAILLINGALLNGAVKLPAKVGDKFDTYKALIDETALELAEKFIAPPADFKEAPVEAVDVTQVPPGPAEGEDEYAVV